MARAERTGATGLEPATPGFGDRCATNCATPLGCAADCIGAGAAPLRPATREPGSRVSGPRLARATSSIAPMPLAVLFSVITLAFGAIAVWSASAHQWVIAAAAAALAVWM